MTRISDKQEIVQLNSLFFVIHKRFDRYIRRISLVRKMKQAAYIKMPEKYVCQISTDFNWL